MRLPNTFRKDRIMTTTKSDIMREAAVRLGVPIIEHGMVEHGGAVPVQAGDYVRSYDFDRVYDCYVEGIVIEVGVEMQGCKRYKIAPVKSVQDDVECPDSLRLNHFIYPPINGTPNWMGGVTNCVRLLRQIQDEA